MEQGFYIEESYGILFQLSGSTVQYIPRNLAFSPMVGPPSSTARKSESPTVALKILIDRIAPLIESEPKPFPIRSAWIAVWPFLLSHTLAPSKPADQNQKFPIAPMWTFSWPTVVEQTIPKLSKSHQPPLESQSQCRELRPDYGKIVATLS